MLRKCSVIILCFFCLPLIVQSCTLTASCYPVSGPLHDSGMIRPVEITFFRSPLGQPRGKLECMTPWGEKCAGEYSIAVDQSVSFGFGTANAVSASRLGKAWATAYGSNFALDASNCRGTATLIGDQGTTVEAEFVCGGGHGYGVAEDSKGNYYRVHF